MNNVVLSFLRDAWIRFISSKPQFFIVIQILALVAYSILGLPGLIEWICIKSGGLVCITIPDAWNDLYSDIAAWITMAIAFTAQFPTPESVKTKNHIK